MSKQLCDCAHCAAVARSGLKISYRSPDEMDRLRSRGDWIIISPWRLHCVVLHRPITPVPKAIVRPLTSYMALGSLAWMIDGGQICGMSVNDAYSRTRTRIMVAMLHHARNYAEIHDAVRPCYSPKVGAELLSMENELLAGLPTYERPQTAERRGWPKVHAAIMREITPAPLLDPDAPVWQDAEELTEYMAANGWKSDQADDASPVDRRRGAFEAWALEDGWMTEDTRHSDRKAWRIAGIID